VGTDYKWTFPAGSIPQTVSNLTGISSASTTFQFTAPGNYKVYVSVDGGVQADSLSITVQPNAETVSIKELQDSVCQGDKIMFIASPSGYQAYQFFVNGNLQYDGKDTFTWASKPGDSIWALGYLGPCSTAPSKVLYPLVYPTPVPAMITSSIAPKDTICSGDTVTFTATPGYATYSFLVGSAVQQTTSSNTYTSHNFQDVSPVKVIVTQNGCESSSSNIDTIYVKPIPFLSLPMDTTICQGQVVDIAAVFSQITSSTLQNYTYYINGTVAQSSTDSLFVDSTFNNGDQVTVTGTLNGCTSGPSVPLVVTVNPTPVVTLSSSSPNDSICQGQSVQFTASPVGYQYYEFFLDNGLAQNDSGVNTYTTSALNNGDSVYVIAVNQECAGAGNDTMVFVVSQLPAVTVGPNDTLCQNSPADVLSGFSPTGGTWTGTGITNPSGTFSPATAGVGIFTLYYTFSDPNSGCKNTDSMQISVDSLPNPMLSNTATICQGGSVQLNAYGGVTYAWSPSTGLNDTSISNPISTDTQSIVYTVTVTAASGCSNTASIAANYVSSIVDSFSTEGGPCAGSAILFGNDYPDTSATYVWYFGDGSSSTAENPTHTYANVSEPDTFNVTLIATVNGCPDTFTAPEVVVPNVTANFSATPTITYNDPSDPVLFNNTSLNATEFNWNFGDLTTSTLQSPSHVYLQPGTFTVALYASNQYGCQDSLIRVEYIEIFQLPKLFIPNAFSPNGDGNNDILKVIIGSVNYFEWSIYDRWGEKVYESNDPLGGWDGSFKGKPELPGVYAYYLRVVFEDNSSYAYEGSVTLVK
jgi:gliding motility-associated-like protein